MKNTLTLASGATSPYIGSNGRRARAKRLSSEIRSNYRARYGWWAFVLTFIFR